MTKTTMIIPQTDPVEICPMSKIHYRTFEMPFGNAGWRRLKTTPDMIDSIIGDMIRTVEAAGYSHRKAMKIARYNLFEYEAADQGWMISKYLKNGMVPVKLIFEAKVDRLED